MTELTKQALQDLISTALVAGDKVRLRTLRSVLGAVQTASVAGTEKHELSPAEINDVFIKEAKRRREAIEEFGKAGRADLVATETEELEILSEFLPQPLSDAEVAELIAAAIATTGASGPKGIGPVMGIVTAQVKGRADGKAVAAEVRRQLG